MTPSDETYRPAAQPDLARLFTQYLQREMLGSGPAAVPPEVILHEALPVQPPDARLAEEGARAALGFFCSEPQTSKLQFPAEWRSLVASAEPRLSVPLAAGNFPQMLRDLRSLLQNDGTDRAGEAASTSEVNPSLQDWVSRAVEREEPQAILLAVGLLRLGRHFPAAQELLDRARRFFPAQWAAALSNEQAALSWHRGETQQAAKLWQSQPVSAPALFNRGLAALFLDQPAKARPHFRQALAQIPDSDPWHHLGQLYLALAEMRESGRA
jgi:tetratricopeptide (TPR) repeat protein